jgi:hypothetical protein
VPERTKTLKPPTAIWIRMTTTKGHAEIIGWCLVAFPHLNRRDSILDGAFRNDTMVVGASVKIPLRRQCKKSAYCEFPQNRVPFILQS